MKSLTRLWKVLAAECGSECGISIERDYETLLSRVEHEGVSFLTITLPDFAAGFERSLELGHVASDLFPSYRMRGGLPTFLSGFLRLVFDAHTGVIREDASVEAVRSIRQLCLLFKKIEWECTPRRKARALDGFIACEEELARVDSELPADYRRKVAHTAAVLFGDVFDEVNKLVDSFELSPSHGPGATADRKVGNQKFAQSEWTERLEEYFPYGEYVLPNWRYFSEARYELLSPEQERPVKVTLVPKTQKTPRIIAIEPTAMQYMQQGLMDALVPRLEKDSLAGSFVGFSQQEPNRDFARKGSVTGEFATLDLSEASDRVLNSVVVDMLRPWPSLLGAVQACRTTHAELPDGRKVRLRKFASMGSALCFPMEEMVFLAIIIHALHDKQAPVSRRSISRLRGLVRVYGDDIIVPVDMVQTVIGSLEAFGLKVNRQKSFWNGSFRESCGGDYFKGEWVTPVRLKSGFPTSRRDVASTISVMETSNLLYEAGYWKASRYILDVLLSRGIGDKPVPRGTNAIAPVSFQKLEGDRWDKSTHKWQIRTVVPSYKDRKVSVDGWHALRKVLAGDFADPQYRNHLLISGRPLSVRMKRGWVEAGV